MNDDELDLRLRTALHAEPSAEQLARLEAFWRQRSRADRRRRLAGRVAALAACMAAIVGSAVWMMQSRPIDAPVVAIHEPSPALANDAGSHREANPIQPPLLVEAPGKPPAMDDLSAGRPASDYERLMFAINTRGQVQSRQAELNATADVAIEQLVADPDADAALLAEIDQLKDLAIEQRLLDRLPREEPPKQAAIVRLLGACGTPQATAALVALGHDESLRPQIVQALLHTEGVERFAGVARQSKHRDFRTALMARMLAADSDEALRDFLSLVRDQAFSAEALAVADGVEQPPILPLMKLLEDDDKSTRLAAAIVLGHMNGPEVTAALIKLVTDRPSASAEAWVALLACRGESANRFLAVASQEPRWLGHVNNARITWARMVQ